MDIEQIRNAVKALPRGSNGKISEVPETLRGEIIRELSGVGRGGSLFAKSIGLSYGAIANWRDAAGGRGKRPKKGKHFRRLEVKAEPVLDTFTVEGRMGLRVEGLSLNELALLFREVSREL